MGYSQKIAALRFFSVRHKISVDPSVMASPVPTPLARNDIWVYRFAVAFLGVITLGTVAAGFYLVKHHGFFSDMLVSIGSTSVGALAGLLAPPPMRRNS